MVQSAARRWSPRHLVFRFLGAVRARPLGPREQAEVEALLEPGERSLFWSQTAADQRHALDTARRVLRRVPGRRDLARAGLLHDVGKGPARLGASRRVVASLFAMLRVPRPQRFTLYLDHGPVGAAALEEAGAEELVVEFARSHHAERPHAIPEEDWRLLQSADNE